MPLEDTLKKLEQLYQLGFIDKDTYENLKKQIEYYINVLERLKNAKSPAEKLLILKSIKL